MRWPWRRQRVLHPPRLRPVFLDLITPSAQDLTRGTSDVDNQPRKR
jgi:hypothetical protein